ncbi:tRNA uridine-5-carboxymethylaminomethyl(34) synthesis GTPase MnmE [Candidatus Phycosocius spiralis]|uniref:tRNA modification GTPase MnmE n=1 Tax=Candidatus Phycosocius spiralis TaxID=2815099 RepID=A0ABQ4PYA1_9PROT|nr:tRNA uridine-5-carboxymethylaminomethyl(34) synthesis GTPase MnmE [Candidatus Phycosocius spiralis]GIU67668.1 tRNA modification GTPase MnmE [Candidatus Phycosocius spiralis]
MKSETIIALASGSLPAGVAIIRLSGPACIAVAHRLFGAIPSARHASLVSIIDGDGVPIDRALTLYFPKPKSFTGEDVLELHVHGGPAVVRDTLTCCLAVPGVRLANPGEFTRRAFENGKMDLSAAEGLADLVEAETVNQRRQALRQMEGALAQEITRWRDAIIDCLVDAEGDIDFPDEDLPPGLNARARVRIQDLLCKLQAYAHDAKRAQRVRTGYRVAIIGPPNSGKSSLLNKLAGRDAAIVAPIAGTTRDIIEVRLVLNGMVVLVYDTAGIRDTKDAIESEGVRRATMQAGDVDLRLALITCDEDRLELNSLMKPDDLWLLGQADRIAWGPAQRGELVISSVQDIGINHLEILLADRAALDTAHSQAAPLTRLRHQDAVQEAIGCLARAADATHASPELIAEDLRLAARALGRIAGQVDVEDVLDRLFAQFCIGK